MKEVVYYCILSMLFFSGLLFANNHQVVSPVGVWTTISDKTHKPRSVVKISGKEGNLTAKILSVFKEAGDKSYCSKCPAPFTNKKIVGLPFVWGMKQTGEREWSGGKVLDPKSGKIYRCKMTLSRDGKQLDVRGYIGFSLFGRTQTWVRRS